MVNQDKRGHLVTKGRQEAAEKMESRVFPDVMVYQEVQETAVLRVNKAKVGLTDHLGGQGKWAYMD